MKYDYIISETLRTGSWRILWGWAKGKGVFTWVTWRSVFCSYCPVPEKEPVCDTALFFCFVFWQIWQRRKTIIRSHKPVSGPFHLIRNPPIISAINQFGPILRRCVCVCVCHLTFHSSLQVKNVQYTACVF